MDYKCPFCESLYRYFFESSDGNSGLADHLFKDHKGQLTDGGQGN